jgi:tetratricopeptide (TPR) repeat protein
VAYGSLLRERRCELHGRIVQAIAQLHGERLADHVERLAYHAVHGELWDRALGYLRQAGAKAFAHSAHKVAVEWFEQALEVMERLPAAAGREAAVDLRLDLRYALTPLGHFTRIHEVLREAEQLAIELGDRRRLGIVSSFLTNYLQVMGDLEGAVEYGQRALEIATSQGDVGVQVVATAYLSLSYQTLGDLPRAIGYARRNIERLQAPEARGRFGMAILPAVYSRTALVRALADVGEFAEGASVGLEALRIAEEADHAYSLHFACLGLGVLYLRQGESGRAVAMLERAHELCRVADAPAMLAHVAGFLGLGYALGGRVADALALLERAQAHAATIFPGSTLGHGVRLASLAEAHLSGGNPDRAGRIGREALEHFERLRALGYQAWALRLLGAVAARTGAPGDAEALYRQASALAERLGMRPLVGQCLLELGSVHHDAGRDEAARLAFASAVDVFSSMDTPFWKARAERQAADAG